jgi:hypothetical protein
MNKDLLYFRKLRFITILMIVCLVLTTLIVIIAYPENTGRNGVISWIITIILLLFYCSFCFYLPSMGSREPFSGGLRQGTTFGFLAGIIWIAHMTVDHFTTLSQTTDASLTVVSMIFVLSVYGYAAFRFMQKTGQVIASLLSAVWSAMLSILILFVFSWIITFLFMPWIEQNFLEDPDYLISGMINISDYTIHHNIESAGIHLLEAPVLAFLVGLVGIFLFRVRQKVKVK